MQVTENTQQWLDRLRTEVAAIPGSETAVVFTMQLAEVEFAHGLFDAARVTLRHCLRQFVLLQPGTWKPLVCRAAELCGHLSENALLEPELQRGLHWLVQPEIVKYQGGLRECVHDIAIQVGRADSATELISNAWPGRAASALVDACRIAGWTCNAEELRRLLPQVRKAIRAARKGSEDLWDSVGDWLVQACVRAGLLAEAAKLCQATDLPGEVTDDLVTAFWFAKDREAYASIRDHGWKDRIDEFRAAKANRHFCSWVIRHYAETIRRLGDADGYRNAVKQFREVVTAWTPRDDWIACVVHCDLAVLSYKAGEVETSADSIQTAKRLFEGKEPGVSTARGNRSRMATTLSQAYRDMGDIDLALRFARRTSDSRDRRICSISALIIGGRIPAADAELAKLDSPRERASLIGGSLVEEFTHGASPGVIQSYQRVTRS